MFLTEDEVIELTSKKQYQAQMATLVEANIPFLLVSRKVKVLRDDVLSILGKETNVINKEVRKL